MVQDWNKVRLSSRPEAEPVSGVRASQSHLVPRSVEAGGSGPTSMDGEAVGRYRLAYRLASGGFGSVYLATMEGPGGFEKFVALKRIHPHLLEEEGFVEMFLDEARIAACISHPNVCGVVDFGGTEGDFYLAMDYIQGVSLGKVKSAFRKRNDRSIRQRAIPFAGVMGAEVAAGLHAAHEAADPMGMPLHIVHRDVSPGNVFLTWNGHAKILDFGIAKATSRLHNTRPGIVRGSLRFMAPEQIRGQTVDRRADVWALGVLLWELVTRRHLFLRDNEAETMFAVVEDRVPPPREVEPAVPAQLEAVILKALMRDPDSRYPTAAAMERDLRAWLSTCGVSMWPQWVAETLRMLFPEGPERQRELLRAARKVTQDRAATGAPAPSPSQLPPPPTAPDSIDVEISLPEDPGADGLLSEEEASATKLDSLDSRTPILGGTALLQRPAPLRTAWIAIAAVCLFAMGGAVSWVVLRNSMAEEQAAAEAQANADGTPTAESEGVSAEPPVAEPAAEAADEGDRAQAEANEVASAEDDALEGGAAEEQEGAETAAAGQAVPAEEAEAAEEEAEGTETAAAGDATANRASRRLRIARAQRARTAERAEEREASSSAGESPFRRFDTPAASGRLNVTFVGGWAEVFVDGRSRGHTPISLELPAGAHRVRVVPQDGRPRNAIVRVRAGETERVVLD